MKKEVSKQFIIFSIHGGIGDQIFKMAFAKKVARKLNYKLIIDTSYYYNKTNYNNFYPINKFIKKNNFFNYERNIFKLNFRYITYLRFFNVIKKTNIYESLINLFFKKKINEFYFENWRSKKKIRLTTFKKNSYYYGYWHDFNFINKEKNFFQENLIKNVLKSWKISSYLKKIAFNNSIAIHFRGGDFKKVKSHNLLNFGYYKKAIQLIKMNIKNPTFYIFTDDIEYSKTIIEKLKIKEKIIFLKDKNFRDIEEFCLFSEFKYAIIANSTFSLMSSYLSNKRFLTICPKYNWAYNSTLSNKKIFKNLKLI